MHEYNWLVLQEEFEDTKGVIRIHILKKDRQHNGQKKMDKKTNSDNTIKPTREGRCEDGGITHSYHNKTWLM
jgi:hypothetical protein